MNQNTAYRRAQKKVKAKIGFFIHLTVYILVNGFLILMSFIESGEMSRSARSLVGWGIGLLFHGLGVFLSSGLEHIKERMIQKEILKRN